MEEAFFGQSAAIATAKDIKPVVWRDLRDWLNLVGEAGQLKQINAPVDPEEELAAITFMAGRTQHAPALLFTNLVGNRSDARILSNMLGASKERFAIAVGLDPGLSTAALIAATRRVMKRRLPPVHVPK